MWEPTRNPSFLSLSFPVDRTAADLCHAIHSPSMQTISNEFHSYHSITSFGSLKKDLSLCACPVLFSNPPPSHKHLCNLI
ncbi:hypothetical protein VNO77_05054 [Canavalia gladiata]|uniref:Uncharacterized protein n=1 Tax=Canavalia gladiata TaxID=3824 RepID=A0AAN9R9M5_CANGL